MTHSDEAEPVRAEQGERAAAVPEPDPEPDPVPALGPRGTAPRTLMAREVGGREGPDPTRFGDWELRGRCIDF
jgi:uncharacterized protein DUF1674